MNVYKLIELLQKVKNKNIEVELSVGDSPSVDLDNVEVINGNYESVLLLED